MEQLWQGDEGDMSPECRDALAALVTRPFVTLRDVVTGGSLSLMTVISEDEDGSRKIRRELDNLGRELVFDGKTGIAYARQRVETEGLGIRKTARRRAVDNTDRRGRGSSDLLYMALRLREYADDMETDFTEDAVITVSKLSEWFDMTPSGKAYAASGDAVGRNKAFNGCISNLCNNASGIGLIEKVRGVDAYAVLPTVLVLVDDDYAEFIANAPEAPSDRDADGESDWEAPAGEMRGSAASEAMTVEDVDEKTGEDDVL